MTTITPTARLQITMSDRGTINLSGATVADIYRYILSQRDNFDTLAGYRWKVPAITAIMDVSDADSECRYALGVTTLHDLADIALHYLSAED